MKKLFLLGGYDLEMLTIKKILDTHNILYADKHLSWEAKLSDYKEYLGFDGEIYGIELQEDITPPKNYHTIDHHGKDMNLPSSLEQLAKIFHIELSRKEQLIAANDAHYIEGMKQLNASEQEIKNIRFLDRQAQGVTQHDELLAEKSIKESYNSYIIFSYTPHFSTIADKIYNNFTHFIIFNEEKIVFYGYEVKKILDLLKKNNLHEKDYYYGGGQNGFVGIKEHILSRNEINKLLKEF